MFRFWDNFKVIRASSDPGARIPRTNYRWSNVTWNIQCRSNVVCYFISRIFMYFSSVDLSFDVLCYPSNIKRIFQTQFESPSLREPPKSFSHLEMSHPFSTIPKMAFLFLFLSFVSNVFESLIGERLGRTSGIGFHNKHHKSRIMEDLGGSWRILDSAKKKERWRGRGARCWNKQTNQTNLKQSPKRSLERQHRCYCCCCYLCCRENWISPFWKRRDNNAEKENASRRLSPHCARLCRGGNAATPEFPADTQHFKATVPNSVAIGARARTRFPAINFRQLARQERLHRYRLGPCLTELTCLFPSEMSQ